MVALINYEDIRLFNFVVSVCERRCHRNLYEFLGFILCPRCDYANLPTRLLHSIGDIETDFLTRRCDDNSLTGL